MLSRLNYRVVLFAFAFIFGVVFSLPTLTDSDSGKKITLGLDLQGGLHMLLGVKTEEAVVSRIKSIAGTVKYILDDHDAVVDNLHIDTESNEIRFNALDSDEYAKIKEWLSKELEGVTIVRNDTEYSIAITPEEAERTKKNAISQAVDTIRNRLDQFGLAEPTVAKQGEDKILVEVPGIKTKEDEKRIKDLIARAAHLQMMAVDEDRAARVMSMSSAEAKKFRDIILPDVKNPNEKYLLRQIPILDGSMLTDAKAVFDQNNQPIITFTLNGEGAKIFGDFSGEAFKTRARMAIVLDDKVYSINERIGGGRGQISGNFTVNETRDIAIALRSGALLAPVFVEEQRSVGPSLGADSIAASKFALTLGFVLVFLFMVLYYGYAGMIADVALIANLFLILAIMSLFGATLTLPGMAGIVLTVGMAVDANVIINERIRELLKDAKAIEDGYSNAFTAIWDANVTTLISAVVLYAYGTGPVKGFALTMSIGILASMLTAILGTHGIYEMLLPKISKKGLGRWFGIKA